MKSPDCCFCSRGLGQYEGIRPSLTEFMQLAAFQSGALSPRFSKWSKRDLWTEEKSGRSLAVFSSICEKVSPFGIAPRFPFLFGKGLFPKSASSADNRPNARWTSDSLNCCCRACNSSRRRRSSSKEAHLAF